MSSGRAPGRLARTLRRLALDAFYYLFAMPLLFVACKLWFGFRVKRGGRRLPPLGGCVVVANHVHYLDAALVALSVWPRKLRVLVDRSNWDHPLIGPFMRVFECIPTGETLGQAREMFARVRAVPREGHVLLVFPEGELACYREGLAPFRRGAFEVAAHVGAPVMPVVLAQRPRGAALARLLGHPCLDVRWGEPMAPDGAGSRRERAELLERRAHEQMEGLLG